MISCHINATILHSLRVQLELRTDSPIEEVRVRRHEALLRGPQTLFGGYGLAANQIHDDSFG